MPDALFADARLAEVYDALDGDRGDLAAYVSIVKAEGASAVLDIGCGTGSLAVRLAAEGVRVVGLDPAAASLAVARRKPLADAVTWIEGEVKDLPSLDVDVVTMTGNVAQVFLGDEDWIAALAAARDALQGGGLLVFESRDPSRRAWETWTSAPRRVETPTGPFETWSEVTEVRLPFVSFRTGFRLYDGTVIESSSTLRFRDRGELERSVSQAGLAVEEVRDAPDRPGLEFVVLARPLASGPS